MPASLPPQRRRTDPGRASQRSPDLADVLVTLETARALLERIDCAQLRRLPASRRRELLAWGHGALRRLDALLEQLTPTLERRDD